jgi:hypothetical protein
MTSPSRLFLIGVAVLFLATGVVGCSHPHRLDLDGFTSQQRQEQLQNKHRRMICSVVKCWTYVERKKELEQK